MVKDIRPTEPEKLLNQESHVETADLTDVPSTPETTPAGAEARSEAVPETSQDAEFMQEAVPTEAEDALVQQPPVTQREAQARPKHVDHLEEEIEDILEEDLKEIYTSMPPNKQVEFRKKGEETRSKVRELVGSAKVNAKKVFSLIRGWLKIIPGVNRFFLEQEAKIKTDKILLVSEEERKRTQNESL